MRTVRSIRVLRLPAPVLPMVAAAALSFLASIAIAANVPGDYPTIQAAVDAGAAQIFVAEGDYHEVVSISRTVELLPKPPASLYSPIPFPRIDGLVVSFPTISGSDRIYVRGFHFTGSVRHFNNSHSNETVFEACRLDSGLTTADGGAIGGALKLRGCLILGSVFANIYYPEISGCTLLGGGITAKVNGNALIRDNLVLGPAVFGIKVPFGDGDIVVTGNIIRNTVDGVVAEVGRFEDNLVEDCSGTAYRTTAGMFGIPKFIGNVARRCGGHGIELARTSLAIDNVVEDAGGSGIYGSPESLPEVRGNIIRGTGSHGIHIETSSGYPLVGNTILDAGGDGINASLPAYWNVVGRSVARGIAVRGAAVNNTSYLNGGAGYDIASSGDADPDSITHNIAFVNSGPGLHWSGAGTPVVACNDWYANTGGATSGIAPGTDDLFVNPLFCNLPGNDVGLAADSPVLAPPGCGLIGARGVGCAVALAVGDRRGSIDFAVRPLPARGDIEFTWTPEHGVVRVGVYDVRGALQWSGQADGRAGRLDWNGRNLEGVPLPPGIYFARRSGGGKTSGARVVIVR